MDKLEKRLREDAGRIRPRATPELRARIAAATQRSACPDSARAPRPGFPVWLAGSLGGLAAAIVVVVLVQRDRPVSPPPEPAGYSVPQYVQRIEPAIPLHARTADLTEPLEEELQNLRADIDKARDTVARDLDFTF